MISVDEALAIATDAFAPLPAETVPLENALARVINVDVPALRDMPAWPQSAMDGYAMHHMAASRANAASPVWLPVTMTCAAGQSAEQALPADQAARVLTGAPLPRGADTIVIQENVRLVENRIELTAPPSPGANIRPMAEEFSSGDILLSAGTRLNAWHIGLLAQAGHREITVIRRPRVLVLVTGDEVSEGNPAGAQVPDSNGPMLRAWFASRHLSVVINHIGDDESLLSQALSKALDENDLVITTGGVSAGDKDFVVPVAEALGVQRLFWKVAQKPGKPTYLGYRNFQSKTTGELLEADDAYAESEPRRTAIIGLPGNPGAVAAGLIVHVAGVIDQLEAQPSSPWQFGRIDHPLQPDRRRELLVRCRQRIDESGVVRLQPLTHQASHMLRNHDQANALLRVPVGTSMLSTGASAQWAPMR